MSERHERNGLWNIASRTLPNLVMSAVLVVAAGISLGMPDWSAAGDYLFGGFPTETAALAVAGLVCWVVVVGVAVVAIAMSLSAVTESARVRNRWMRSTLFLAAGVIALGMGALHHNAPGYAMCCGTQAQHVTEAQQLASTR